MLLFGQTLILEFTMTTILNVELLCFLFISSYICVAQQGHCMRQSHFFSFFNLRLWYVTKLTLGFKMGTMCHVECKCLCFCTSYVHVMHQMRLVSCYEFIRLLLLSVAMVRSNFDLGIQNGCHMPIWYWLRFSYGIIVYASQFQTLGLLTKHLLFGLLIPNVITYYSTRLHTHLTFRAQCPLPWLRKLIITDWWHTYQYLIRACASMLICLPCAQAKMFQELIS